MTKNDTTKRLVEIRELCDRIQPDKNGKRTWGFTDDVMLRRSLPFLLDLVKEMERELAGHGLALDVAAALHHD